MYLNAATQNAEGAVSKPAVVYEAVHPRWEIAFALSDGELRHVSFVNSISTSKGGTHVDMISTQLANKL
jgi:DNA topoisomerase-2